MASASHILCAAVAILGVVFQAAALLSPTWKRYEAKGSPIKNRPPVMVYEFLDEWNGTKLTFLVSEFMAMLLLLIAAVAHIMAIVSRSFSESIRGVAHILNISATFLILMGLLVLMAKYGNILQMFYVGLGAVVAASGLSLFAVICSGVDDDKHHAT